MAVAKRVFGNTPDGQEVELYSITNKNGMCAEVMTYGATLVNLLVPGKDGKVADINLGYDCMEPYTVIPIILGRQSDLTVTVSVARPLCWTARRFRWK